ncbi:MAG: ABC transporter substrate-binding protein [Actinomycetota bacterium]
MSRYLKLLAVLGALAMVAAACAGQPGEQDQAEQVQRGGTLIIAQEADVDEAFDPQKEYYSVTWEWYRCCLLRNLMSYNGKTTAEGGAEVRPDLAAGEPEISDDGLTWTFTLKEGLMYAPPFQDTEIVAQDFIRAMEREGNPDVGAAYSFYYNVIEGFSEYSAGDADTISGMVAEDDHTLSVTTTEAIGDLGFRLAMPAGAPIPEGADVGHEEDYGRFLVASGPYMFEGSENLDFSLPPEDQEPVSGYNPGRSIVVVRNPSWAQDDLRPANVERIEATIGGTSEDIANKIDAGEVDIHLDGVPPAQQIRQYRAEGKESQIHVHPSDAVRYISMNVAMPPFDDIHVRKAFNLVLDKDGMRRTRGGPDFGEIAGHIMVDALQNNLLADFDPFATPNSQGDVEAAQEEMRQSAYDTDGDGVCDAPECENILSVQDEADPYPDQTALIQQNLQEIGITLDVRTGERTSFMYQRCNDPAARIPLCMGPGWGKDFPDGTTFGEPLFGSAALGPSDCCNYSILGATPEQLEEWGYEVTSVPSADEQIARCEPLTGDERVQCWADLDQYLMEEVVPWVPWLFDNNVNVVSARLQNYSFDQFAGLPALDHVGVGGGAQETPEG